MTMQGLKQTYTYIYTIQNQDLDTVIKYSDCPYLSYLFMIDQNDMNGGGVNCILLSDIDTGQ